MLSRVAERIYWMARYLERAENTARLINVDAHLHLDLPKGTTLGWSPLIEIMGCKVAFNERSIAKNERNIINFLAADLKNHSSIYSSIYNARENARTVRDAIPSECWEVINSLYEYAKNALSTVSARKVRFQVLNGIIEQVQKITGILSGTVLRGKGYLFLKLGRYLERADMTSRILDVRSENLLSTESGDLPPFEHIQWISILNSLSAHHSYRQEVKGVIRSANVLHFLLSNTYFPRSFSHCMGEARHCLKNLPHSQTLQQRVIRIMKKLQSLDYSCIKNKSLYLLIDQLQIELAGLNVAISKSYFSLERNSRTQKLKRDQINEKFLLSENSMH